MSDASFCPQCGKQSSVIESRHVTRGFKRRRECASCGHRYNTFEVTDKDMRRAEHNALMVEKLRNLMLSDELLKELLS